MRIVQVFILSALLLGGVSCNNSSEPAKAPAPVQRPPASSKLTAEGTQKLMSVVSAYYQLKNALVATNAMQATEASKNLQAAADSMVSFLQADSANKSNGLQPYLDTVVAQSKIISAETDAKCEKQRIAFSPLSNNMFALLKAVEIKNAGVYKQFCPMAFNDKGASWLSDVDEIKNPYFGKKMMECGEVQDSL